MSKLIHSKVDNSKFFEKISSVIEKINEVVEKSNDDHALLVLGVSNPTAITIKTIIHVTGPFATIAEGLYAVLIDQIKSGDTMLFTMLQQIVREIESSNINPEDHTNSDHSNLH